MEMVNLSSDANLSQDGRELGYVVEILGRN